MPQDYTAIRVTEDAKEIAEESKRDGETWNEFIQRCSENPPEVREFVESTDVDSRELGEATADYLMAEYNLPQKVAEKLR